MLAHAQGRTLCSCKMCVDPLSDHVLTCKQHRVSIRGHNHLMDVFAASIHKFSRLFSDGHAQDLSRLADFLFEQIELQAKLLNYFLGSNKSNINQSAPPWRDCDASRSSFGYPQSQPSRSAFERSGCERTCLLKTI